MTFLARLCLAVGGVCLGAVVAIPRPLDVMTHEGAASSGAVMLDFRVMVGVTAPFTGVVNAIRGVPGAPGPWSISDAKGRLRADGHVRMTVEGLVISAGPLTGTNPLQDFRAVVSCQSRDGAGAPSFVNVSTGDFPATPSGDAHIEETLSLPDPCIAPIVFVTSSSGVWLATTGS